MGGDTVVTLGAKLVAWLRANEVVDDVAGPASKKAIAACEKKLGRKLPASLVELLELHNGGPQLLGGADLLDVDRLVEHFEMQRKHKPARHRRGILPFAIDGLGDYLALDANGAVVDALRDEDGETFVARSLEEWLARVVEATERGEVRAHRAGGLLPRMGGERLSFLTRGAFVVLEGTKNNTIAIEGPAKLQLYGVEGTIADVSKLRFTLAEGQTTKTFDVAREAKRLGAKDRITVTGPALVVKKSATLSAEGLGSEDSVWLHFSGKTAPIRWRRVEKLARGTRAKRADADADADADAKASASASGKRAVTHAKAKAPRAQEASELGGATTNASWGLLDAPDGELPQMSDAPAILAASLKRRRKYWGTGRSPAAKRIFAEIVRAWGGRSKSASSSSSSSSSSSPSPSREANAAFAKLLSYERDGALSALIATWLAKGGIEEGLAILTAMNEIQTFISSARLDIKVARGDALHLPVAAYLARELTRVSAAERARLHELAGAMRANASPLMRLNLLRIFQDATWAKEDAARIDKSDAAAMHIIGSAQQR